MRGFGGVKVRALMYHDVIEEGLWDSSGFSGARAGAYKLERQEFERHLAAIRTAVSVERIGLVTQGLEDSRKTPVLLTFDDGGASAYEPVADLLESHGWRGYFFVTTGWIGTPGFLDGVRIRELHARGHVIGSHSCSHPAKMAGCPRSQLNREWGDSIHALEDILGEAVTVASVPGGHYSRRVAESAAEVGIQVLFNSEPTATVRWAGPCLVLGRYVVRRGMAPETSAGFASGSMVVCVRQAASWKLKKATKAVVGSTAYSKVRDRLLP